MHQYAVHHQHVHRQADNIADVDSGLPIEQSIRDPQTGAGPVVLMAPARFVQAEGLPHSCKSELFLPPYPTDVKHRLR